MDEEQLNKDLSQIEDGAWCAAAAAEGLRFVLGNLLLELRAQGVFDALPLMTRLLAAAGQVPGSRRRTGCEELAKALAAALAAQPLGTNGTVPPGTVFH